MSGPEHTQYLSDFHAYLFAGRELGFDLASGAPQLFSHSISPGAGSLGVAGIFTITSHGEEL